jgi:hypothetical protein
MAAFFLLKHQGLSANELSLFSIIKPDSEWHDF